MEFNWYNERNIIHNLNRDKFQNTDINTFEEHYTLHDSDIIDIKSLGNRDLILVILFDPVWNDELGEYQTEYVQRWPILFLFFTQVKKFEIDFELESDMPFGISTMETKSRNNNELVETIIDSHYGDVIKIIHSGELKVLLYDENENIIKLSKL